MNNRFFLYVVVFVVIIILVIVAIHFIKNKQKSSENFGIDCLDYIDFEKTKKFPLKKDAIFISIASYRDDECLNTVNNIYENADKPENIYLGIHHQNKDEDSKEFCLSEDVVKKYGKNIREYYSKHSEAKGPAYARYWCSKLWEGEEFFFQIDSHINFIKHWDTLMLDMYKKANEESPRPVLSFYPPPEDQILNKSVPVTCKGDLSRNIENIIIPGAQYKTSSDKPLRSTKPFAAAGFMFLKGDFLYELQYDPNIPFVFMGEEILFSARLWTHGYDIYIPNVNVASHHYYRNEKPKYWNDVQNTENCKMNAEKRVRYILGFMKRNFIEKDFLRDIDKYGLGTYRTLEDFWKASGVTLNKNDDIQTIEDWCTKDTENEKLAGWNFNLHGYDKIKKYIKS